MQRKTISKSTRIPDENADSEPRLRRSAAHFTGYGFVEDRILFVLTTFVDERSLLPAVANQIDGFFSRIDN